MRTLLLATLFLSNIAAASATSLTVFAAASTYCEKRALGMERVAAIRVALYEVRSNSLYDPDYNLPNFPDLMVREIAGLCPQYLR